MKSFLIRACTKIGHFIWSWGFLKFILWMITLIIFFYVEEDWRGARAWAATKAEWEAKGETFDYSKFIPPPIPDDQNLGAIPLFKMEPYSKTDSFPFPVNLHQAMGAGKGHPGYEIPPRGNWQRGELPDMAKIQKVIATDYAAAFKGATPPGDSLAQFDALYPFITDLLAAARTRPLCRFDSDYTISPPASRALGLVTAQSHLSIILTLHAILALNQNQSDLALEDIKTNYKLLSGAKRDPTLVGGLVAIEMTAITHSAIYDGLAVHAWNDAQLAELEQTLEPVNYLADYQFGMRSEAAEWVSYFDFFKKAPGYIKLMIGMSDRGTPPSPSSFGDRVRSSVFQSWPEGWWDDNKGLIAAFLCRELTTVDSRSRRAFPNVVLDLQDQVKQARARWDFAAPWRIWFTFGASPLGSVTPEYAQAQVWVDEARIACALERFRLAHGVYPDSLDALVPAYIDNLPHDIMNGEPYHYRLRTDGTFLLYSVGWNQVDEGGKVVYKKDAPAQFDSTQGDWVWPTAK